MPDQPERRLPLRWTLSAHAGRLGTLALAGLALAILTRRPEFAGLAAPALLLLATWRTERPAALALRVNSATDEVLEEETVPARIWLSGQDGFDTDIELHPAISITPGPSVHVPARSASDEPVRVRFQPTRWGHRRVGAIEVTVRDSARLTEGTLQFELPRVRCTPRPAQLESTVVLSKLRSRLGEHPARIAGDGIQFAGVREFVPGDRQRRINWPATTRRGTLHLSTFAAERLQNVVIVADTTVDVGETGLTTVDLVVRGAAGTIVRYLASRDRVGLISYGAELGWIAPGQGRRHARRLIDLLVAGPIGGLRPIAMTRLPRAALPPGALILVFSPLLDPRLVEALRDLRERGFTVVVVDVLNARPEHDASALSRLTARLWALEQQAIRFSLTQIGVPVAHWDGQTPLDEPLAPYTRRALVVRH